MVCVGKLFNLTYIKRIEKNCILMQTHYFCLETTHREQTRALTSFFNAEVQLKLVVAIIVLEQ